MKIVEYARGYGPELVIMWRKSFEQAIGIRDPHPLEDKLRYLEEHLLAENRVRLVLDDNNEAVVGLLAASSRKISQLYVHVDYQNKGIGSRLLNLAKQESDGSLRLFTFECNQRAQRFYEKHGFRIVGRGFEENWQLNDIEYEWTAEEHTGVGLSTSQIKGIFRDPRLSRMANFLRSIEIEMRPGIVDVPTLFPGSLISKGSLIIDESVLIAPGDALHEAAHIALSPPERRVSEVGFLNDADDGEELAAIAWCWAALLELEIAPEDIFHPTAYKRGANSQTIIDAARRGVYIGFPLLQYWGMAFDEENALRHGVKPFPHMVKWLRE